MRASILLNAAGGFLLATGIVAYFSPAPASFWGNTFFGIPYPLARIAVPVSAATCAAIGSYLVRRTRFHPPYKLWVRAILISCAAFGTYALLHTVAYIAFALVRYSTNGEWPFVFIVFVEGLVFGLTFLFFGSVFLPLAWVISAMCEWLSSRVAS